MTSAYSVVVSGEAVQVLHFEEDLAERDLQLLAWHHRAAYEVDDVRIVPRAPVPGVRPLPFRSWVAQNMTSTEVLPPSPDVPVPDPADRVLTFRDDTEGEDLRGGSTVPRDMRRFEGGVSRKYSADRLRADATRAKGTVPARSWNYVDVEAEPDFEALIAEHGFDWGRDEDRAYGLELVRYKFRVSRFAHVELGRAKMSGRLVAAVWVGGGDGPGDGEEPDF